jgi:C-terminal domain 7 of the ABC-three component (ABC-3C) systems
MVSDGGKTCRGRLALMTNRPNKHEASASATGYLFQCRYALLVGLQAIADAPQLQISIEKLDDIGFEEHGEPVQLIQTKHHLKKTGNLADASVDLWKTLHIWIKLATEDVEVPFRVRLVLLTTAAATEGAAAGYLRVRDRDEAKADAILMKTAAQSKSQENADAYKAFKDLAEAQRFALIRAITVLDGSSNIVDVHGDICREVRLAVSREHIEHFVERLEGWWFGVIVKALTSVGSNAIPVLAIDNRLDELREEFRRNSLPVDYGGKTPPASVIAELDRRPFVRQLRRIEIGNMRVEYAIRDYYRASEQRSKWAREELLVDGELQSYERELVEAWEPRYAAMLDELKPGCLNPAKVEAGQALYKWVETDANFPLRTVRERFLTHGSFHILSNQYVVGWHPEYATFTDPDPNEPKKG